MAVAQLPLVEGGATGRVAVATMRGLAHHGVAVRAVAAVQHFTIPGEIPGDLDVDVVTVERPSSAWSARAASLIRPRHELAGAFAEHVRAATRDADIVHLEEVETAWCRAARVPTALRVHYLVKEDRPRALPWHAAFRERATFAAAERRALRRASWLVANSAEVAGILRRRAPHADVTVAPLTLDPGSYATASLDGPPRVGLIGTATWPPTAAAMRRLAYRVWPLVRKAVGDAQLVVGGRGVESLGLDGIAGVEVVGNIDRAATFIGSLSVLTFPLDRGSGAKVKVLEALACGVPVVTTKSGAEGVLPNDGLNVAHQDDELAAVTARILRDGEERRQRGSAALVAFRQHHAPAPATEPLAALYRRMAEQ